MYKVLAIGSADLCAGLALAGIEVRRADHAAVAETLSAAIGSGEYGIIIIDEDLSDGVDEMVRRQTSGGSIPLVIAVPGRMRWHDSERSSRNQRIAALIRQAVGYQLDIQL